MIVNVSEHFSLAEAEFSRTATVLGIDNSAPSALIGKISLVAVNILEPIRAKFGPFSPTSWYRCQELNDNPAIGGRPNSQHVAGEAADIAIPGISRPDLAAWAKDNLPFDQIALEYYTVGKPLSGWVHISYFVGPRRGDLLTIGPHGTLTGLHP